jgi:hypothetical protein
MNQHYPVENQANTVFGGEPSLIGNDGQIKPQFAAIHWER